MPSPSVLIGDKRKPQSFGPKNTYKHKCPKMGSPFTIQVDDSYGIPAGLRAGDMLWNGWRVFKVTNLNPTLTKEVAA